MTDRGKRGWIGGIIGGCWSLLLALPGEVGLAAAPAPPDLGPNVLVFDPGMTDAQTRIDAAFKEQERSHFGVGRYALLFTPGRYELRVPLGFYTQALGLGKSPDDVMIHGTVESRAGWMRGNATLNFWRGAENLSVIPGEESKPLVWAVSQGTAMRRVHVRGDMNLWDGGWSSGGFLADCAIDGRVNSGSQQQWLSRNTRLGHWTGGAWNMVFVGTENPPKGVWPDKPYTVVERTPLAREKPYLFIDDDGSWKVRAPGLRRDAKDISWTAGAADGRSLPLDRFYLARPEKDNAASLNAALSEGRNLLFTPGIYHLKDSVRVTRADTIVLGLGFPTLIPDRGTTALVVGDAGGVEVGGILFEAGVTNSATLLQVGEPGRSSAHRDNPIFLFDIYCRVGGTGPASATSMVTIHSDDVVGDNFWLWRADHGSGAGWSSNPNEHGLIVEGDHVTVYGLFVEHAQGYQTLWKGNGGRVYFYQSEMPYDPPDAESWRQGDVTGFASYKVADTVKTHEAWGLGVYCVFWRAAVVAENAFETPQASGVRLHHLVTIRLNGRPDSGIRHILNGRGESVITKQKAVMD